MINIEDYKSYFYQHYNFLELLRENNSLVYDRLEDVFKVLSYVELLIDEKKEVEEELEIFFEVGFSYIHEQIEEIKIYYSNYFDKNFILFKKYEKLINYNLYLSDLEEALKEKSLYTDNVKVALNDIKEQIEIILSTKKGYNEEIFEKFDLLLEQNVHEMILTTVEIFAMVVEELQI